MVHQISTLFRHFVLVLLLAATLNLQAQYCSTSYTFGTDWAFLNGVELNDLTNLESGDAGGTYCDFTDMSATLIAGHSYTLRMHNNLMGPSGQDMFIGAWIDYNQNGEFEVEETVTQLKYSESGEVLEAEFTVPPVATGLTITRLRVRQVLDATMTLPNVSPCDGEYMCGETEDYTIIIEESDLPLETSIESIPYNCDGNTLQAYPNSTTLDYAWFFEGELLAETSSSIIVSEAGLYAVAVSYDTNISQTEFVFAGVETLAVDITTDDSPIVCPGDIVTLNVPEGFENYAWFLETDLLANETNNTLQLEKAGTYFIEATDMEGCTYTSEFVITEGDPNYCSSVATGINDPKIAAHISVYPNPASDFVTIAATDNTAALQANLLDISGKIVLSTTVLNTTTLAIDHLSKGVYFLQIESAEGTMVEKILVR